MVKLKMVNQLEKQIFSVRQILDNFINPLINNEKIYSKQLLNYINDYRGLLKAINDCLFEDNQKNEILIFEYLNKITDNNRFYPLEKVLFELVLLFLNRQKLINNGNSDNKDELKYYLNSGYVLNNNNIIELFLEHCNHNENLQRYLKFINPIIKDITLENKLFLIDENTDLTEKIAELNKYLIKHDQFSESQSFSYCKGDFTAVSLSDVRDINDFYGYTETRRKFNEYFKNFRNKIDNSPLLICSFPGLGKTQLTVASTLQYSDMTLILADIDTLENNLERLIGQLSNYPQRKFVVFFDDIEPEKIDWYYFRTHVGGYFKLPENITIIIASNYKFPINIQSRGRYITFPEFDSFIAKEMVVDDLKSLGMRKPSEDLVNVITADYLDNFGQQVFQELSPRSLVRYLQRFNKDIKMRAKMLEFANNKVIPLPDEELFHRFNINMLRNLYGEEAVVEWRNKYLGDDNLMPYIAGKLKKHN